MIFEQALKEWKSKKRRMGCVAATYWFCQRVNKFYPLRLTRYTREGKVFQHMVATDGMVHVDFAPYSDKPSERKKIDGS